MIPEKTNTITGIKSWAEDDRPREKLLLKGASALSDAELIAILIGSGSRNETAVDLSKRILQSAGNSLNDLGRKSLDELQKFKGIGEAKAVTVAAALELGRRRKAAEVIEKQKIISGKDVFNLLGALLGDLPHEEFWALYLNQANKIMDKVRISSGGVTQTVIDAKMVMKPAIEKLASALVVCHNHPSGNVQPSEEDISLTKQLIAAGKFLNIRVLDHVIVSADTYFSFFDNGLM